MRGRRDRNANGQQAGATASEFEIPHLIRATCATDMTEVGRRLKHGERVLLDLGALPGSMKRRMLDACAGLVYGCGATATRTMTDRYLLEPAHPTDDRPRQPS